MDSESLIVRIPLKGGLFAVVDLEDYPLVSANNWQATMRRDGRTWYATRKLADNRTVWMHRVILGLDGLPGLVDHRDNDGLNNRRRNIRKATISQNAMNRRTYRGPYLRGTQPRPNGRSWRAYITVGGLRMSLGNHPTEQAAHAAYVAAAREHFGEFFPDDLD